MTLLEEGYQELIAELQEQDVAEPFTIGFAGPPGAGKSTLIEALLREIPRDKSVAVIASDPSSPYTGGALLGDRTRILGELPDNIYYRSLATRGSQRSLAPTARRAARLLALAGFDWIIFETVGVGQNTLDVEAVAAAIVLVLVPESGDDAQAIKSGILELADLIVVNKSDRPGKDTFLNHLHEARTGRAHPRAEGWAVPLISTIGTKSQGVDQLLSSLTQYQEFLKQNPANKSSELRLKQHLIDEILEKTRETLDQLTVTELETLR